jgi:hypothetical protein
VTSDNNGSGIARTVSVNVSALGSVGSASLLVIEANTNASTGPMSTSISPTSPITISLGRIRGSVSETATLALLFKWHFLAAELRSAWTGGDARRVSSRRGPRVSSLFVLPLRFLFLPKKSTDGVNHRTWVLSSDGLSSQPT